MMNKRTFLKWHRWIALVFAPLLLLQAATGAILVLRDALNPPHLLGLSTEPSGALSPPISALAGNAERYFPGYRATRLFLPTAPGGEAFVKLDNPVGDNRYATINPRDGRVLDAGSVWRFPLEAVLQWHFQLMKPSVGIAIVIGNGAALAILAMSGIISWWPGRKQMLKALAIRRSANANLMLRQYHRSAGAIAAAVLLFSAITGIILNVPSLPAVTAGPASQPVFPRPSPAAIDRAVALASTRFPQSPIRDIRFGVDGRLAINFFAPERNPRAVHVVVVDAATLHILTALPAHANTVSWMIFLPLHTGESLGLLGQMVLLAAALGLIFLTISGPLSWWRSRKPQRARK